MRLTNYKNLMVSSIQIPCVRLFNSEGVYKMQKSFNNKLFYETYLQLNDFEKKTCKRNQTQVILMEILFQNCSNLKFVHRPFFHNTRKLFSRQNISMSPHTIVEFIQPVIPLSLPCVYRQYQKINSSLRFIMISIIFTSLSY